jgi:hypothetical protein
MREKKNFMKNFHKKILKFFTNSTLKRKIHKSWLQKLVNILLDPKISFQFVIIKTTNI